MTDPTRDPQRPAAPPDGAPSRFAPTRRDLETGCRFLHGLDTAERRQALEGHVWLTALVEELVERGLVDRASLDERVARQRGVELEEQLETRLLCRLAPAPDKYNLTDLPAIDCAARLPACRARCCTFTHLLSAQDLDEGLLEWELDRPYVIRADASGTCVHHDRETHRCSVYEHRPASCREYDCRHDDRIWVDFEAGIPAESETET